jgi:hypothetical protein
MNWGPTNPWMSYVLKRCYTQITYANNFIIEAGKVDSKGFAADDVTRIKYFAAEARYLRAFQFWVLMDLFGNVPFTLVPTAQPAPYKTRADLFAFVESELKAVEPLLLPAGSNHQDQYYGRADQGSCWALMARMYLNAKVYTNTERYADAATYAKKVIDNGNYSLTPDYRNIMATDNDRAARNEFLLTVNYDGNKTKDWGGTTFLTCASNFTRTYAFKFVRSPGDTIKQNVNLMGFAGWSGIKATPNLTSKFANNGLTVDSLPDSTDRRAMFLSRYVLNKKKSRLAATDSIAAYRIEMDKIENLADGLRVWKFRNRSSTGAPGSDISKTHSDIDFPLFRLAEMHLIYAEAAVRGQGDLGLALQYINALRDRAYGNSNGRINASDLTLQFLLDERSRELYWEGHRRTDLVRYELFTSGSYLWAFKGGVKDGVGVEDFKNIYPLPSLEMSLNPNLKQNPGY